MLRLFWQRIQRYKRCLTFKSSREANIFKQITSEVSPDISDLETKGDAKSFTPPFFFCRRGSTPPEFGYNWDSEAVLCLFVFLDAAISKSHMLGSRPYGSSLRSEKSEALNLELPPYSTLRARKMTASVSPACERRQTGSSTGRLRYTSQ